MRVLRTDVTLGFSRMERCFKERLHLQAKKVLTTMDYICGFHDVRHCRAF